MSWIHRLWNVVRLRRLDAELEEELRFHVDMRTRDNIAQGMPPGEARHAAARQFGNWPATKERTRDMNLVRWIATTGQDLRYALRVLRKNLVFTTFAVATMALGIGSTTLIVSVVSSLLLEPPPFKDANRLYMLWGRIPQEPRVSLSSRDFSAWSKQTEVFEKLAAFTGNGFTISGGAEPVMVVGQMVTTSLFEMLGVPPVLGRIFLPAEGEPGHDREVILSYQLWRDRFGSQSAVLGKPVMMNGEAHTVVGVMPAGFEFPSRDYKLWVPMSTNSPLLQQHPDARFLRALGKLKAGMPEARVASEIGLIGKRIGEAANDPNRVFYSVSLRDMIVGDLRRPLLVFLGAVGLLLLIACANVANLMLARANARRRELAVRSAIGASGLRLVRQLLIESITIGLIGGLLGVASARWGVYLLVAFGSKSVPQLAQAHLDSTALLFALVVSLLSGVAFGILPALSASRLDFQAALKGSGRSTDGAGANRTRSALVFAEIALASVLLVCSGLMLRSFISLLNVDPGFRASGVSTANLVLAANRYPEPAGMLKFYRSAMSTLRSLPGAEVSGMITHLPFGGNNWGNSFEVEGQPAPAGQDFVAQIRPVSPVTTRRWESRYAAGAISRIATMSARLASQ